MGAHLYVWSSIHGLQHHSVVFQGLNDGIVTLHELYVCVCKCLIGQLLR